MCNLYDLDVPAPFIKERFRLRRIGFTDAARADKVVRPSVKAPVVFLDADGERVCSLMEWGFVRQWKSETGTPSLHRLFNVRSETIDKKPAFAHAYRKTRAIIPASGYYELPEKGVHIRISRADGDLFALAGLWEEAIHPRTGETITAFTMAMTDHNAFTAAYHQRMPCLLEAGAIDAWLDPLHGDAKKLLMPYVADDLVAEHTAAPAKVPKPTAKTAPAALPISGDLFG